MATPLPSLLRPLAWLGRHATPVIASAVFVGLLLQPLAAALKPLLVPAILVPFIAALLRLDADRLRADFRRPMLVLGVLVWLLIASPVIVLLSVRAAALPEALASAMVTTAGCAPLMASGALALLLGLDAGLAILATVLATTIVPLSLPPLALNLAHLRIDLEVDALMLRLGLLIGASFLAAALIRRAAGKERLERWQDAASGAAVVGLVVFAIAIMDGVGAMIARDPGFVAAALACVFALNLGLQAVTALAFARLGRSRALTLGLVAGNNNIGIVVAALADRAPERFLVYVAMAQFPIYLLPALQRPLYRRLLERER
jgi:BASS family bile acid:Na+ symporter